jgi:hypothetical protein
MNWCIIIMLSRISNFANNDSIVVSIIQEESQSDQGSRGRVESGRSS